MFQKVIKSIFQHKIIAVIIIAALIGGGYFGYKSLTKNGQTETRYALAQVKKGIITLSVSGSGQVAASDQVDIKPKIQSDVVYIGVKNGQEVKAGDLLAQIDSRDAQRQAESAQTALETAKLDLEELLSPPDELDILKAENAALQAKNSLEKLKLNQETEYQNALDTIQEAEENIQEGYEDAFNEVTDAFFDLPTIIAGLRDILYSYDIAKSEILIDDTQDNASALINSIANTDSVIRLKLEKFIDSAKTAYKTAREKYDINFADYKETGRYSKKEVIEALLNDTLETARAMSEAIKNEINMLDFWVDYQSGRSSRIFPKVSGYQSDLKSYTSKTNGYISGLLSVQRSLQNNREAKLNAERSLTQMEKTHPLDLAAAEINLKEKEKSLADLKAGADELDIRNKKNVVQQKEDALAVANENLASCYIRAPFGGVIAGVYIKKGDSVSSGSKLFTLSSDQKIADITLNEIDVSKIEIGQKATVIFDAVEGLTITGEVAEIDTIGTVSQGVVSYVAKVVFDTQDERVKPGMSVSATIIAGAKTDALMVANSGVKSQGDNYFVQMPQGKDAQMQELTNSAGVSLSLPLVNQAVEIGISNDEFTEITSGLKEGDIVVVNTINIVTAANNTSQQSSNSFRIPGMMGR